MPKKVSKSKKEAPKKESCFVIMPYSDSFNSYYDTIYKKAIENVGLIPSRADDLYRPSAIVKDIWNFTKDAKVILADLTGKNPNVFYELGLAHALSKPAVLITNTMDDVPYDLQTLRVIVYNKEHPEWGHILQSNIELALKETINSPLDSVLPIFSETEDIEKTKIEISERDFLELKRDVELLKRRAYEGRLMKQISPQEAEERIRVYLRRGYSSESIIRRLRNLGVPEQWTIDMIELIRSND